MNDFFPFSQSSLTEKRPDTRQSIRGRLGRSSDAKSIRNSKILGVESDGPTDQGVGLRVRDQKGYTTTLVA